MKKEDILQKLRAENEVEEPYETEVARKSFSLAAVIALAVAALILILEWGVYGEYNFGVIVTVSALAFVKTLCDAIRLKGAFRIVMATLYGVVLAISAVAYAVAFHYGWL